VAENTFRLYAPDEAGPGGYSLEWHRSIKHAVREQAGFRCARCQHPYRNGEHGKGEWSPCDALCKHGGNGRIVGEPVGSYAAYAAPGEIGREMARTGQQWEAHWRILTVHHLDGDKLNCRWWNLAALCQVCHLQIQGRVRMERVWPWEHSEWFRRYVAGFYAWQYLREDLSREEVEARLPELLALELVS
jgi:hypothetical protein